MVKPSTYEHHSFTWIYFRNQDWVSPIDIGMDGKWFCLGIYKQNSKLRRIQAGSLQFLISTLFLGLKLDKLGMRRR